MIYIGLYFKKLIINKIKEIRNMGYLPGQKPGLLNLEETRKRTFSREAVRQRYDRILAARKAKLESADCGKSA